MNWKLSGTLTLIIGITVGFLAMDVKNLRLAEKENSGKISDNEPNGP